MSSINASDELPPAYDVEDDGPWPPTILVLAGQSIHAESADTAPLFQLNRGIANLGSATTEVELSRVQYAIKGGRGDQEEEAPEMKKPRPRHVYNLKFMNRAPGGMEGLPSTSPHYHVQSISKKQTLGHIGLRKSRMRSRYSALPLDMSGKGEYGIPQFVKDAKSVFQTQKKGDHWEWLDGEDKAVAVQEESDGQHKLLVTAELRTDAMTTLVALWCCRIWEVSAENAPKVGGGMDGVRQVLKSAKETPSRDAIARMLLR
ncbi:short-chain dehydrogenase/reductase family Oxidoreductase [Apiospora arundinis]|uniref:Short-chain dehydrogenase/reductase family Oxidoreductase n=1 Tax=Apiospora arundinis TaxID=335852 RepID=A0ABR2ISL7_9PEZI